MTLCDQFSVPNLARDRHGGRSAPPAGATDQAASACSAADLAEADRLISDLAALLDAGLIAVQEHVLGPARYGAVWGAG
jgi:hypothetical protein